MPGLHTIYEHSGFEEPLNRPHRPSHRRHRQPLSELTLPVQAQQLLSALERLSHGGNIMLCATGELAALCRHTVYDSFGVRLIGDLYGDRNSGYLLGLTMTDGVWVMDTGLGSCALLTRDADMLVDWVEGVWDFDPLEIEDGEVDEEEEEDEEREVFVREDVDEYGEGGDGQDESEDDTEEGNLDGVSAVTRSVSYEDHPNWPWQRYVD